MPLKLPRFERSVSLIDVASGRASVIFHRWWQLVTSNLETSFNGLEDAVTAVAAAQAAADAAQAAATTAQAAADTAQTAADTANSTTALTGSGVTGCTISAADAGADVTITISAHTRIYGDGTQVAVDGGSLTAQAYSTVYYIYYDQAARTGGAVTYVSTTVEADAAQVGDRHLVGKVTTPAAAAAATGGSYVRPSGLGSLEA